MSETHKTAKAVDLNDTIVEAARRAAEVIRRDNIRILQKSRQA